MASSPNISRNASNYGSELKAADGRVGAIWSQCSSFITCHIDVKIPTPPNDHTVHVMADGRFGQHDLTRWPQFYDARAPHLAAIPTPPTPGDSAHRYHQYLCMWSDVVESDVRWSTGSVGGIGSLKAERLSELRTAVGYVDARGSAYSDSSGSPEMVKFLALRKRRLQAYLDRLEAVPSDLMSIKITMVGMQQLWLEVVAGLDYAEVYQPIMNGEQRVTSTMPGVIGTYSTQLHVVEMFKPTPIPVFFIRPLSTFSTQVILRSVELVKPPSQIFPSPRLPVVYSGPPSSAEKLHAMFKFSFTYLTYRDPFEGYAAPNLNPRTPSSGPSRAKKTKSKRSKPPATSQVGRKGNPPKIERDKFKDLDGEYAPRPLPAWVNINQEIKRDVVEKETRDSGVSRPSKYAFPDPGMFVNPELQSTTRFLYFAQLEHIFDALIYRRASSVGGSALRPQDWRDILSLPRFIQNTDSHRRSESVNKAKELLGACFASQGVHVTLTPPSPLDESLTFNVQQGRFLIWKLCELNFRCELASLDRMMCLMPKGLDEEDADAFELERSSKVLQVFPENSLTTIYSTMASFGIYGREWTSRCMYLDALRELMKDWSICRPGVLEEPFAAQVMPNETMERALARHYAQCFFDCFHRPPITPCIHPSL